MRERRKQKQLFKKSVRVSAIDLGEGALREFYATEIVVSSVESMLFG
jgi:hypothetical protein